MSDYKNIISAYKDKPGGLIEAYHALQKNTTISLKMLLRLQRNI